MVVLLCAYGGFIMLHKTTNFQMLNFHYAKCFICIIGQQPCEVDIIARKLKLKDVKE